MSIVPKSSLVERLVQDRLRTGNLEASAAHLLRLGDTPPGDTPPGDTLPSETSGGDSPPRAALLSEAPNGLDPHAASLPPVARALAVELAAPAAADPHPVSDSMRPAALSPVSAPTTTPAPTTIAGLAPAALVAPLASARPAPIDMTAPEPAARRDAPAATPRDTFPSTGQYEGDRPELVQGPPQIDAVALERGGMVDWSRTRSRISEEFRLVQRQILRSAFGPGAEPGFSNLLMVTSARPGEGKSFTSVNLAGSIARQGDHHVLLVDSDSKRDSFCYALGLAEMRGLLDLVANPRLDPSPLIVKTPIERLSILPVGRERERSAELFSTKEMTRLIQSLGRRYADRLLILDAPPCLSTSDPAVLAPVVGQILFVVEADRTQRDEVEASLDLIQACPNIALVLNKQQISSRYTFGAYSSYYSS